MATEKVAIVYSPTTAALYFGLPTAQAQTAYDDLFMAAQQQARAAGVSYDILTESQLTTAIFRNTAP
jgi:serralysin